MSKQIFDAVREYFKRNGIDENTKPFRINIVGIRTSYSVTDKYDDIFVTWRYNDKNELQYFVGDGTTKAGLFYTLKPMNPQGVACITEGYHKDIWRVGLHHGKTALKQCGTIKVYRDNDRDKTIDKGDVFDAGAESCINFHYSDNNDNDTKSIGRWSAGCQVWEKATDFSKFMVWAIKDEGIYQKPFSYTLISKSDIDKIINTPTLPLTENKVEKPQELKQEISKPVVTPVIQTETPKTNVTIVKKSGIIDIIIAILKQLFKFKK